MATGFCPALLLDINDVAGQNAPGRKLHIAGFLAMLFCCQNSLANVIQTGTEGGHRRTLTVKYRPRPLTTTVQDEDDCDINAQPAYSEWNVPALSHKQVSFFLPDETVRQYCIDASRVRDFGQPRTAVMEEVYGLILEYANTLMKAINQDLVTEMSTGFGENASNGDDGGTLINFNTDGNSAILNNGLIQILRDIEENEICGTPCLVGGGLWSAEWLAQSIACCNNAGMNLSALNNMLPRLFFDKDTQSIWGANSAGLFAPGSVKFISWDKYVGPAFTGQKGTSFFTNIAMPVNEFGCNLEECLRDLRIDVQLKYIDCPGEYDVNGTPTALGRGWQVILSKDYALWVQPTTGFQSGDSLADTNGTIKYFASNTSYSGGAYSLY
jgi:hypothetical protein